MSTIQFTHTDTELHFTQTLRAPRKLIFEMFSNAQHVQNWWIPGSDWDIPVCTIDFRPGGEWRYCFRNSSGDEHWAKSVYTDIRSPELISFIDGITDETGEIVQGLPVKHTHILLTENGSDTTLSITVRLASRAEKEQLEAMGFIAGFTATLNQLHAYTKRITKENT